MTFIYFENFFLNFIFSFIFLLINFVQSISINNFLNNRNILSVGFFVIFSLIIATYAIIFNLIILLDLTNILEIVFFSLFLLQILTTINLNSFKLIKKIFECFDLKIFFYVLIPLFFVCILPISDADSIAIHLNIPNEILSNGYLNENFEKNIESTLYSSTETILLISNFLKSDNFGSQLNFFSLLVFLLSNKKNESFYYILLSSPLIIFLISTQKLQLFYSLIFLQIFILINNKIEKKNEIFAILFLIFFYITGKLNYLLFGLILYIFFVYRFKKYFLNIILLSFFIFLVTAFPFFLIKFINYGNPLVPFFDQFFQKREFILAFESSIRSTEGWLNSDLNLKKIFRPFVPLNLNQLSTSFGILFIYLLFNYNLLKKTYFIPLVLTLIIFINGQLLPRYYLEAFLVMAYYFNLSSILKKICLFQMSFILLFSVIFLFKSYNYIVKNNFDKKLYQINNSYSYKNSIEINKMSKKKNILVETFDRDSLFFNNNIYSFRYLNILKKYEMENNKVNFNDNFVKFVIKNDIKLYATKKVLTKISCIKLLNIDKIKLNKVTRNFLVKYPQRLINIYEVNYENCKK